MKLVPSYQGHGNIGFYFFDSKILLLMKIFFYSFHITAYATIIYIIYVYSGIEMEADKQTYTELRESIRDSSMQGKLKTYTHI